MPSTPDYLILGAGVAGLTCARRLTAAGHRVTILDKGRGPGGRLSTRRETLTPIGSPNSITIPFDHGAQYLTARDERFIAEVGHWLAAGAVARWNPRLATLAPGGHLTPKTSDTPRYVGTPGMSAICKHLAAGVPHLDLRYSLRAASIQLDTAGVSVRCVAEDGSHSETALAAPRVVIAVPDVQARQLAGNLLPLPATTTEPCWATIAEFAEPITDHFDAAWADGSPLRWLARDSSKPGRPPGHAWVLHASPEWSRQNLELTPDEITPRLLAALADLLGKPLPTPRLAKSHRWRYALTPPPPVLPASPFAATPDRRLSACGDYLLSGKIESAFLSGHALAEHLLATK